MFDSTEQRICDQARAIRKNGLLTNVELEVIKRRVLEEENSESQDMGETQENVDGGQEMEVTADERHYLEEENKSRRVEDESRNNENGVVIEGEMNDEENEMAHQSPGMCMYVYVFIYTGQPYQLSTLFSLEVQ